MNTILEILLSLIIDGKIDKEFNKRLSYILRVLLIMLIILSFLVVIFSLFILGVLILKESILRGIFGIGISIVLFCLTICNIYNIYKNY